MRPFRDLIKIEYVQEKGQMSCSVRVRGLIESRVIYWDFFRIFVLDQRVDVQNDVINPQKPLIIIRNLITCPFQETVNNVSRKPRPTLKDKVLPTMINSGSNLGPVQRNRDKGIWRKMKRQDSEFVANSIKEWGQFPLDLFNIVMWDVLEWFDTELV